MTASQRLTSASDVSLFHSSANPPASRTNTRTSRLGTGNTSLEDPSFETALRQHVNRGEAGSQSPAREKNSRPVEDSRPASKAGSPNPELSDAKEPQGKKSLLREFDGARPPKEFLSDTLHADLSRKLQTRPQEPDRILNVPAAGGKQPRKTSESDVSGGDVVAQQEVAQVALSLQGAADLIATETQIPSCPQKQVLEPTAAACSQENSPAVKPRAVTDNLALALRITSAESESLPALEPARDVSGSSLNSLNLFAHGRRTSENAPAETETKHELESMQILGAEIAPYRSPSPEPAKSAQLESTHAAPSEDFEKLLHKVHNETVRDAHLQVSGADNQRVDVRLLERNGSLSVSLRSSDALLVRALQDSYPELGLRLSAEHFQTEFWAPARNETHSGHSPDSRSDADHRPDEGSSGEQRQHKNHKEPDWVAALDDAPHNSQKRINYVWHQ